MTANWKVVRNTFIWLLIAVMTLGIVIASPYAVKSSAASQTQTVVVAKATTGTWGAVKNGKIDTSVTGVYKNKYGWWYVKKGLVQFQYTGIQKNQYGWWRIEKGKVNFNATGVYKNEYGWWRVEKGKVNFKANAIYQNKYGWWKTTNGKVTFKEEGVFKNDYGWWYVKDSKVDFGFNGLASNKYGLWYVENGCVDFKANKLFIYDGKYYDVENSKATETTIDPINNITPNDKQSDDKQSDDKQSDDKQSDDKQSDDKQSDDKQSDDKQSDDKQTEDRRKEAVEVVEGVLKTQNASRADLIKYMTDKALLGDNVFTVEEAKYGVENANVDWNTQAVIYAAEYLIDDNEEPNGFSNKLLAKTLKEDELFSDSEVAYAMKLVEKDYPETSSMWNKSAAVAAKIFVDELKENGKTISRDDLKTVLKDLFLFTDAQAAYGAQNVKL